MIHKKFRVFVRVGLVLILSQAWHNANAVSVTGNVSTNTYVQEAQALTTVRWFWAEMSTYEEVFTFARIKQGSAAVATDSDSCTNFFSTSQQTCTALAILNQCTDRCPYTGNGHGDKVDIFLTDITNVRLGNWGPITEHCESGEGN